MSLQNRVTPFGDIVAVSARGLFIGNRGIIHDPATRTLRRRRWASKTWIVCTCDYRGVRRPVMADRSWTELFFLDEATAFAAGHRPCFLCRRPAAEQFREAWAAGNRSCRPSARAMDEVLHDERLEGGKRRHHPLVGPASAYPDGTMVAQGSSAYLVMGGSFRSWSHHGYALAAGAAIVDRVLTPPSIVAALQVGYRPVLHPSWETTGGRLPA